MEEINKLEGTITFKTREAEMKGGDEPAKNAEESTKLRAELLGKFVVLDEEARSKSGNEVGEAVVFEAETNTSSTDTVKAEISAPVPSEPQISEVIPEVVNNDQPAVEAELMPQTEVFDRGSMREHHVLKGVSPD